MKNFMDDSFMLHNKTAERLYNDYARDLPVIDYHCHLPPEEVAADRQFENMTKIWLDGDHYKWRAMRANGIPEEYCTGSAPDSDKFMKWAETVPHTLRNPLYHWTHMELQRPFGIKELLNPATAAGIYEKCNEMLATPGFSARNIMRTMKVELVCTTDDPADSLEHHIKTANDGFEIRVLPTWRPDRAMAADDPVVYNEYIDKLEEAADMSVSQFDELMTALRKRHDFFHEQGCRLSDHGLDRFYAEDYTYSEVREIFASVRSGKLLPADKIWKFKSAMLFHLAVMDHEKGWTQQFHVGALRNNSTRMFRKIGADKGFDSIGDFEMALPMSRFFNRLDMEGRLAKTILYNLNPRDNEVMVTMAGNFNDGSVPGKMQFGSGWWFLDQKDGMERQLNTLSNMGLLSRFVGMLTDSRSFLSYPRHDYFRRILCNLLGKDIENGEMPGDMDLVGSMVSNICYHNAKNYLGFGG
ncbi:MAG: glucuronate isomerase [Marinilabiliales bacterium]|nr:MAG: glucuronate isomerase [Marinilabiliales bacterium]